MKRAEKEIYPRRVWNSLHCTSKALFLRFSKKNNKINFMLTQERYHVE